MNVKAPLASTFFCVCGLDFVSLDWLMPFLISSPASLISHRENFFSDSEKPDTTTASLLFIAQQAFQASH